MSVGSIEQTSPSIIDGQNFYQAINRSIFTGDPNDSERRLYPQLLAAVGSGKKQALGQEPVSLKSMSILTYLRNACAALIEKLTPKHILTKELTEAFAETQEGQAWIKEDQATRLKATLGAAFRKSCHPAFIRREDILIEAMAGNEKITIIGPGAIGTEHANYKISASIGGEDFKAVVSNSDDRHLFGQLEDFNAVNRIPPESNPRNLSLQDVKTIFEQGSIVNADLLLRKTSPADDTLIDNVGLYLKHNGRVHYFTVQYTGHTLDKPYDIACVLEITGPKGEKFKHHSDFDIGLEEDLGDAAENLITTKLKEFNKAYGIKF